MSVSYPNKSPLPSCFFNMCFNIIHPSVRRSSKWSLSCSFSHQNPVCISYLCSTFDILCQSHLHHLNNMQRGVQIMKLLIWQFCPSPSHIFPLRPKYPSIFLSMLYLWASQILKKEMLCSEMNLRQTSDNFSLFSFKVKM